LPKIVNINLGINVESFVTSERKEYSFVWSSMPLRGLLELLKLWPKIKEMWPLATLNIYYGWEVYDLLFHEPRHMKFKWQISSLVNRSKDVKWIGRIPQTELIKKWCETDYWFYPPNYFKETFCCSALEAMAAGCNVVSRANGALAEVIGNRGTLLDDNFNVININSDMNESPKQWALKQNWKLVSNF
jgi:glycosyltransferase involved in cell wall biosynthesis